MTKNILKIIAVFLIGAVGGIFADQILWPYFIERPLFLKYRLEQPPIQITEIKEITVSQESALKDAVEKVGKTIVGIRTKLKNGKTLEGSGLIVSSDGLVVTFADLIPTNSNTLLFWEGESPSFQVLKRDPKENLALLKINRTNLPTAGFADFSKLRLGEKVFLAAMVFEKAGERPRKIVNDGIIKAIDSASVKTNIAEKANIKASPLFNISAEAVGLNMIDSEGKVITIPIEKIRAFIGL